MIEILLQSTPTEALLATDYGWVVMLVLVAYQLFSPHQLPKTKVQKWGSLFYDDFSEVVRAASVVADHLEQADGSDLTEILSAATEGAVDEVDDQTEVSVMQPNAEEDPFNYHNGPESAHD